MSHARLTTVAVLLTSIVACGTDVDLGGPDHCGTLVGPSVPAGCKACKPDGGFDAGPDGGCQPNGCYGGYWCNTAIVDCDKPPTTCQ